MKSVIAIGMAMVVFLVVPSPSASAASPEPSPSAVSDATSDVAVTIRVAGEPCAWKFGCRVGVSIVPTGADSPILEGLLDPAADPSSADGALHGTLPPGTYDVAVTARGFTEKLPDDRSAGDAETVAGGGCGATLDLVDGQPAVELTASMAWLQPACGIAIEPRATADDPRPVLADPIRSNGPPPRFQARGRPTASATDGGIKLELWVKDPTLEQGQWLLAHLRVTNVGRKPIAYTGRFADLDCPPLDIMADTTALFHPGRTWTGVAGTYKERFFRDGILLRAPFGIPKRDRGDGCGDVGYRNHLKPGQVVDVPLAGMPAYGLRDQPLPPGPITLSVGFAGPRSADRVTVSTDVDLAGHPVAYPSPGQLVDAALETPGVIETLERSPDPKGWANTHVGWWKKPPYPKQPRLDGARTAPHGILEVSQFLGSDMASPFVVGAVIDPWTGESYGSFSW